jgi:hypothetical protein
VSRCPYLFSAQTILKVHLYAPDLGEIIPTSEKRASDSGEDFTPFYVAFQIFGIYLFLINVVNQLLTLL